MATLFDRAAGPASSLPAHLRERLRPAADRPPNLAGEYVLYWVHNALRAHENPALDVALLTAKELSLPVFVYQGLSERYQFASDRHHTFILQGARDAHAELAGRGIGSAFHLERPGHRGPHLRTLAGQAAVVVTEDLPTDPIPKWVARLLATTSTPIWLVDTACVVPMRLVGKAHDRAFAYRTATRKLLKERLTRAWPEIANPAERFVPPDLPFDPVDLPTADLAALVGACEIDHAVGPVKETAGGSRAGYSRWDRFRDTKLRRYADDRNDPLRDPSSRLSPYLHYGMVSPLRVAREAAAAGGPGADKYLDELLVWRELAYTFCHHRPDHETLAAVPPWAVQTLREHERDPRPILPDWETLARGRTNDPLWDAAQRSLLAAGELHNNLRMTWGKAFLNWTPTAAEALRLMADLNHRYALDGRDPASSGGLLWCLGQFDRPFPPARPISGTVRGRPTAEHASRLDHTEFSARIGGHRARVAVVGAGIAGLACARTLQDHGFTVTVFEKSGRPGGRAATRRAGAGLQFDHGAQYFTARSPDFVRYVQAWQDRGVVAEWGGRIVKLEHGMATDTGPQVRYVGVPGMAALGAHLAMDLAVRRDTRITRVERQMAGWDVTDDTERTAGPFDVLAVALPAPQAADLLASHPLAAEAAVTMQPCWSVMVAFSARYGVGWDGAFVHGSPLSWVARDSSKPGRRAEPDAWVLHAGPDWSAAHLDSAPEAVATELMTALAAATGVPTPPTEYLSARRWLYSMGADPAGRQFLADPAAGLVVCGDWLAGGRVEGAFRSGVAAAGSVLRRVCT